MMTRRLATLQFVCALVFFGALTSAPATKAHFHGDYGCSSSDYLFLGGKWPSGVYTYYTELDAYWAGGYTGRWQVLYGQLNWNYTSNPCGQPDSSPFAGWWGGGVSGWVPGQLDYVNFRDMGPTANIGCPGAVACAPYWREGGNLIDADQRFEIYLPWYYGVGNQGNRYDLQSVSTHESGHNLGLADLYQPVEQWLTLYGSAYYDTTQRSLGWGDYTGMQALYP